jgi:tetratricopeptide (TPR) repeat protein
MKKKWWRTDGRWVLLVPVLCFVAGSWYFTRDRTDLRVSFERAREEWRSARYEEAIAAYLAIQENHPESGFAPECLWETATIFYYNLYDISNAMHYFYRLIAEYPESPRALEGHLRLAEIFELELNESLNALDHWNQALAGPLEETKRWEVKFRVADTYFKLEEFDLASEAFKLMIAAEGADKHLVQRSQLRLAAIHQVQRRFEESIDAYNEALRSTPCADCRLQAQLGLVESYEVLDRLSEAIETARAISSDEYPPERREELLRRLLEKRKYYEPGLWGGL